MARLPLLSATFSVRSGSSFSLVLAVHHRHQSPRDFFRSSPRNTFLCMIQNDQKPSAEYNTNAEKKKVQKYSFHNAEKKTDRIFSRDQGHSLQTGPLHDCCSHPFDKRRQLIFLLSNDDVEERLSDK